MDDRDSQKRMLDYDFKARDGTLIPGPSHFRRFSMSLISFSRGGRIIEKWNGRKYLAKLVEIPTYNFLHTT